MHEDYPARLTVGRSRSADFSLKRTEKYRTQAAEERDKDEDAQTVTIILVGEKQGNKLIVQGEEFTAHHESDSAE